MSPQHELRYKGSATIVHMYVYVCTVDSINTQLTSLQPHTHFHLDVTLPHSTAGRKVTLIQLTEVLGSEVPLQHGKGPR